MNSGLNSNNATLVAAFRSALLHQGLWVLLIFAVLAVVWVAVRELFRPSRDTPARREPAWRQVLRIGFGVLWLFDGLLQAQPDMPGGLPSQAIEPAASSSPHWVQDIVNWAGTSWSYHPVQVAAATVWIQAGIGVWLLAAPRGSWSRLAGWASVAWGLIVWVFGEAFGGIFAPGLTWLFGAPGAALFYCAAGILIALPERRWRSPELGRAVLAVMGVFFVGMAVLQAWPGRGFWQGTAGGKPGTLTSMVADMSGTPQPALLAGWARGFGSFTAAHGFAVNLFAVIALAGLGAGLITAGRGPAWLIRATVIATVVLCLADWVLIEDFGFFGGVGTDPNSMIPLALVVVAGYLALRPAAAVAPAAVPATEAAAAGPGTEALPGPALRPRPALPAWRPSRQIRVFAAAGTRAVLAVWAVAIIVLGAAPMALAQANRDASPVIAQALNGQSAPLNYPAPAFTLTGQNGQSVSLASLRGKVVLLTFLDPVCTSDCPVIGQEFKEADEILGAKARDVELVAIVANPQYRSTIYTQAFDREDQLTGVPNWRYLTGSLPRLQKAWKDYGVTAEIVPAGGMVLHQNVAFVIDARGEARTELNFDPGPATSATESSLAVELADAAAQVMKAP